MRAIVNKEKEVINLTFIGSYRECLEAKENLIAAGAFVIGSSFESDMWPRILEKQRLDTVEYWKKQGLGV